jgi:signal transduction histidine kinase
MIHPLATQALAAQVNEDSAPERTQVLVVDDDERNLHAIKTVLEDVADVVLARSGEEALRHLLKADFAVILLDVYMPGMDGYETAQLIRSREHTKRIPIIFISAINKDNEHLARGYAMGAVDYVFKPVEPIILQSKVSVFVDLFQMRREIQNKALQEKKLQDENILAHTERLRAERELSRVLRRQSAIIESLPIVFYLENRDAPARALHFVSGNFLALTGYTFESLAAEPDLWLDRTHPDDRARLAAAWAARHDGLDYAVEYRWQTADGSYKHFLDQALPLADSPEYAGTLLDVTDRKELESELLHARKMDAIGQLTGGIAHDFNNLLTAVLGGLELIEARAQIKPEHQKFLAVTRRAAEQGASLVARLLVFARKQKLEPASIDIAALSSAVTQLLSHTLGGLVTLEWHVSDELWQPYADAGQLELALMNLAINARDAMPNGGTIDIRCHNAKGRDIGLAQGDYVVLAVSDTGCGIAQEDIERVTEPFYTTKMAGKGTGLGLSMVYGFARQSGGTVRIQSHVNEGTTVEIWLPRALSTSNLALAIDACASKAATDPPSADTLRVLLVDDHDEVRVTVAELLEELGYRTLVAASGNQAMALFSEHKDAVDVVVSDYAMPSMSGSELIQKIREQRPGIAAIIITGYAEAIANLPDDTLVIAKPFTPKQLQMAIASASGAKSARQLS